MNDYDKMRNLLASLNEEQFIDLYEQYNNCQVFDLDKKGVCITFNVDGGQRYLSPLEWRQELQQELLSQRETNKAGWNELCALASVQTDSSAQMALAKSAVNRANMALLLSFVSIVASIVSRVFWK